MVLRDPPSLFPHFAFFPLPTFFPRLSYFFKIYARGQPNHHFQVEATLYLLSKLAGSRPPPLRAIVFGDLKCYPPPLACFFQVLSLPMPLRLWKLLVPLDLLSHSHFIFFQASFCCFPPRHLSPLLLDHPTPLAALGLGMINLAFGSPFVPSFFGYGLYPAVPSASQISPRPNPLFPPFTFFPSPVSGEFPPLAIWRSPTPPFPPPNGVLFPCYPSLPRLTGSPPFASHLLKV